MPRGWDDDGKSKQRLKKISKETEDSENGKKGGVGGGRARLHFRG